MNNSLKEIAKIIKKAKSVAIFTHIDQDCDALGSSVPLMLAIRSLNKKADVFIRDELTYTQLLIFDKSLINNGDCNPDDYDLLISTDVPSKDRIGYYGDIFMAREDRIVIDHHMNRGSVGKYKYIDTEKSSCCEITFQLLKNLKVKITPEMATYLYAGLSSDTHSFMNENTNKDSFKTAIELLDLGADVKAINYKLYKTKSAKEAELLGYLWKNYVVEGDIAYCLVDNKTLTKMKAKKRDCDGFSAELLGIDSVKSSFSLIEAEVGFFNLSARGKADKDVRAVAEKLGGGGHLRAAGAKFNAKDMEEAKNMVLKAFKD